MFVNTLPTETERQRLHSIKVFYCPKLDQLLIGIIAEGIFKTPTLLATYQEFEFGIIVHVCEPAKGFILIGDLYE